MKKNIFLLGALLFVFAASMQAAKKTKTVKISVEPKEAAIYVNNTFGRMMRCRVYPTKEKQ